MGRCQEPSWWLLLLQGFHETDRSYLEGLVLCPCWRVAGEPKSPVQDQRHHYLAQEELQCIQDLDVRLPMSEPY